MQLIIYCWYRRAAAAAAASDQCANNAASGGKTTKGGLLVGGVVGVEGEGGKYFLLRTSFVLWVFTVFLFF